MSTKHPHRSTKVKETYHHLRGNDLTFCGNRMPSRKVTAVTAFIRPDRDGNLFASFAECDSRDQFNRKVGRTVARRKWFAGSTWGVFGDDFASAFSRWSDAESGLSEDANDAHLFIG